jgi:hypothetical protein
MGWWSYLGVAGLVAASVWSFVLARRPGDCAVEMVRDAQLREQRGTPARRFMRGALASGIVIVALYGLHVSINGFV